MSAAMKEKILKYWTDVHGIMVVATVLDPMYKMKFLYAMFSEIYGPEGMARETKKVRDLLLDLVKEYQSSMEGFGTRTTDGIGSSSAVQNEGDAAVFDIFEKYLSSEPTDPSSYVSTVSFVLGGGNVGKNNKIGHH
jgi:hypothetical protein